MAVHGRAVLQGLFVTFLWSTSWVLIKVGLEDIPALTFAGLRYAIAFVLLTPIVARPDIRRALARLSRRDWLGLTALGLVLYTVTQGAQFLALDLLPAQTTSLILSISPIAVALLGTVWLHERATRLQGAGIVLFTVGAFIFLYPADFPSAQVVGVAVAVVGMLANPGASLLGRAVNRSAAIPASVVTLVSMGVGAALLLAVGATVQGVPQPSLRGWAIVLWLAAVNSAFAFTLWNATLRRLSATESSVINNTMLIQIAVLAWLFLGEPLGSRQIAGLGLASVGTLLVQLRVLPWSVPARRARGSS